MHHIKIRYYTRQSDEVDVCMGPLHTLCAQYICQIAKPTFVIKLVRVID